MMEVYLISNFSITNSANHPANTKELHGGLGGLKLELLTGGPPMVQTIIDPKNLGIYLTQYPSC